MSTERVHKYRVWTGSKMLYPEDLEACRYYLVEITEQQGTILTSKLVPAG